MHHYAIYRDGAVTPTATSPTSSFDDTGRAPSTSYSYRVSAVDAAGNESTLSTPPATATTAPPGTATPTEIPDATWQTGGASASDLTGSRVESIAVTPDRYYLGGSFLNVRPPGVAWGTGNVTRNHLAAFDSSGALVTSWNPNADGVVDAVAVDPASGTVFVSGAFTHVGGQARAGLAALDPVTGQALAWDPAPNSDVKDLIVANNRLYVGGKFGTIAGASRNKLAAFDLPALGLDSAWRPTANKRVNSIASLGSTIFIGGIFESVSGDATQLHLAALDAGNGALLPLADHPDYYIDGIAPTPTRIFLAEGGPGGKVEAFSWPGGSRQWTAQLDGDMQAIAQRDGVAYAGGHQVAYCDGGTGAGAPFVCDVPITRNKFAAVDGATGALTSWNPNANGPLGVFDMETTSTGLVAGGEFSIVHGQPQQGFARFTFSGSSGSTCPTNPGADAAPEVDWSGCDIQGANLSGANLSGANLTGANLTGASVTNADLSGVSLSGANLSGANLSGANLDSADLTNANLTNAGLTGVRSGGIVGTPSFLPANWSVLNGYLIGPSANLSGADLSFANLTSADLSGANLNGANLSDSDLTGASLAGANLTNANFTNADLTNADLTGAQATGVNWTHATCPDGQNSAAHLGGSCVNGLNTPPTLDPIGNKNAQVGIELAFTATATDPNAGDTLTFSLDPGLSGAVPAGASITNGGNFTWTPTGGQVGPRTFDVCVSDGTARDCETITVTVSAASSPTKNDFTGDAKADILLRNSGNGQMYLWQMNGSTLVSSTFIGAEATVWATAGVADFTGDGKADILLRNSSSGAMYLWQMNGATLVSSTFDRCRKHELRHRKHRRLHG